MFHVISRVTNGTQPLDLYLAASFSGLGYANQTFQKHTSSHSVLYLFTPRMEELIALLAGEFPLQSHLPALFRR